jgi:hypothetical protein
MREKTAAALVSFVLGDIFANYCLGRQTMKEAIRDVERQARRIHR